MNNRHKDIEQDICGDCFEKGWRMIFCKKCHEKVFYLEDATCDECNNEADYKLCDNCSFPNRIREGREPSERYC